MLVCGFRVKIGLDFVVVKVNLNVQEREGLIAGTCKPIYRAIFCFIHFFALGISSSVSSFL